MEPDEGPYRQSAREALYQEAIERLWAAGALYACDCRREDVEARTKDNATPGYDGFCRDRGLERGPGRALRFAVPHDGDTVVSDVIRGEVSFPRRAMEDFVVVKSDGQPLFVLANVVDDRDMAITHAIRGVDLLPSAPKGVLLWEALDRAGGATPVPLPFYAHLPLLVNEQGKKLSKRRDEVALEFYRDEGFLPAAFRNFLALLGWSPPGQEEKVPVEELVAAFDLAHVHHAPAFFDVKKLTHLNGEYVRELTGPAFVEVSRPWVDPPPEGWRPPTDPPWPPDRFDRAVFDRLAPVVQERVTTLSEVPGLVDFVFLADPSIDEDSWEKAVATDDAAPAILDAAIAAYGDCPWDAETLHEVTNRLAEEAGRKLAKAQAPIRVAVTGRRVGPPLFQSLEVLGRDEVLRRLRAARDRLSSGGASTG